MPIYRLKPPIMHEDNFNIYERFSEIEQELIMVKTNLNMVINRIEEYEKIQQEEKQKKINEDANIEGFWTIVDILRKYSISEQTFCKWKRLVHLKTSGKQGKKLRYNKKNVVRFFENIQSLKISNPELFRIEIKKKPV